MRKVSLPGTPAMVVLAALVLGILAIFVMGKDAGAAPQTNVEEAVTAAAPSGETLDRATLHRYAEGTWASFEAMTEPNTGLPADTLRADGERSVKTSTTNIGAYIWSVLVAEELGIITHDEAVSRLDKTITTLEGMERHESSGQ